MVFNATFNNISVISWRSVLVVEETVVGGNIVRLYKENEKNNTTGVENSSSPTPGTRKLKLRACRFSMEKGRWACL